MIVALVELPAAILKAYGLKRNALLQNVMTTSYLTAGGSELGENGIMLGPQVIKKAHDHWVLAQ